MTDPVAIPSIIQGGMGFGISDWRLARAVSRRGQLGVVSGTALDLLLVRRLQDGDPGGHMRRGMAAFPIPGVAAEVLQRYFYPTGREPGTPYKMLPAYKQVMSRSRQLVSVLATFVEVFLAREGHQGQVGINLLTKIQISTLEALYGAMLAGVEVVLMGAGIPRDIPAALDRLALHQSASLRFDVEGLPSGQVEHLTLDPLDLWATGTPPDLCRPRFLAIIASNSLATMLARKATGRVDGFVIEGPTAGGHNAPPRGEARFNDQGEPLYGERDVVDLTKIAELGLPFWLAGGTGRGGSLSEARARGAAGIQVGTLFAYCDESGMAENLKRSVLAHAVRGEVTVRTDPRASPTGYPFKVVHWPGAPEVGLRDRLCDLGALRVAYWTPEGKIGFRCPGEPVADYVRKGGSAEDTSGRQCICNGLTANIGLGQIRGPGVVEPPILTSGDDLESIGRFLADRTHYTAADVLEHLLS